MRSQENKGQAGYGKRERKGWEAGAPVGWEAEEISNLVPRVSHLPAQAREERPWLGLVTCLPESGR